MRGDFAAAGLGLSGIVVGLAASSDADIMLAGFVHGTYFLQLFALLLWVGALWQFASTHREALRRVLRARRGALLAILGVGLLLFVAVPHQFRVLADEANLVSISRSLAFERRADNVIEAYRYYGGFFHPERRVVDKRPVAYPYLVSVLHALTGYRVANAFAVNFIALLVLLGTCYFAASHLAGPRAGPVALLLVAGIPQLSMSATSAGLEPLYLALLGTTFALFYRQLRVPSPETLQLLVIQSAWLLASRHEAVLAVLCIVVALFIAGRLDRAALSAVRWYLAATPWLLLPLLWQHGLQAGGFEFPGGGLAGAFSAQYLAENLGNYLAHFTHFRFDMPFATLVELVGLAALLLLAWRAAGKRLALEPATRVLLATVAVTLLGNWLLIMFYYWGSIVSPASARLFLPYAIAFCLAAAWGLDRLSRRLGRRHLGLFLAGAALLLHLPIAIEDKYTRQQPLVREFAFASDFLADTGRDVLFVSDRPGMLLTLEVGAVHYRRAREESGLLLGRLAQRLFDEIYVLQRIDLATGEPRPETRLPPVYRLEPLRERQNGEGTLLRISRVLRAGEPSAPEAVR